MPLLQFVRVTVLQVVISDCTNPLRAMARTGQSWVFNLMILLPISGIVKFLLLQRDAAVHVRVACFTTPSPFQLFAVSPPPATYAV